MLPGRELSALSRLRRAEEGPALLASVLVVGMREELDEVGEGGWLPTQTTATATASASAPSV